MTDFKAETTRVIETELNGVTRYTFNNTRIYKIPVESYLHFFTNAYLILDNQASLLDPGTNQPKSMADLEKGFATINRDFKEDVRIDDVSSVIITHGHGDHFAILADDKMKSKNVYIHSRDSNVIKDYLSEHNDWEARLRGLLKESGYHKTFEDLGTPDPLCMKGEDYRLTEVSDGQEIINGYKVCHTPGHSGGHICLKIGPILLLGDHMLSLTTPHQVPRDSWHGVGLEIYLASLKKVSSLGTDIGLAGHEDTIYSVKDRAHEIEAFHYQRLQELLDLCQKEKNLYQLTREYYQNHLLLIQVSRFEDLGGMDTVMALEEIKAHVEYLIEHNRMMVGNEHSGVPKYRSWGSACL